MTVTAKTAVPGKIYRLTRDAGTAYYKICDPAGVRRLEKRLSVQSVEGMRSIDRFAKQALNRCRTEGYVLAVRVLRFRDDKGQHRETKAYVAFPPDYLLREVEKPPGYTTKPSKGTHGISPGQSPRQDTATGGKSESKP